MITVRFPNGCAVQYNTANHAVRARWGYTDLYDRQDGTWIAQVPTATCIIERVQACRVYNPLDRNRDDKIEDLAKEIRSLKRKVSK